MKKQIIALSGLPGSGKTTARTTDAKLRHLPYVDIADIYMEYGDISSGSAFNKLLNRAEEILQNTGVVVLEAAFCDWQRNCVEEMCRRNRYCFSYRNFKTPAAECVRRVEKQYEKEADKGKVEKYYAKRFEILSWFM